MTGDNLEGSKTDAGRRTNLSIQKRPHFPFQTRRIQVFEGDGLHMVRKTIHPERELNVTLSGTCVT